MKIVNINQVAKVSVVSTLFTGSEVYAQPLAPEDSEFNSRVITFGKGVRNKFHSHESDQILIVISGKGFVAIETEQCEVTVGDVIFFSAGEKHWHGATNDCEFSHIYINMASSQTIQLED